MTFTIDPATIADPLEQAYRRLADSQFANALWSRNLGVWGDDPAIQEKVGNRLGWLDSIEFSRSQLARVKAFAGNIKGGRFTDVVLLGMGGSSLAPEVLRRVIGVAPGWPRFRVLDSVDPDAVREALEPAATSLFIFASKSGGTIEPNVMAAEAQRRLRDAGVSEVGSHFIAITDEGTALHTRAREERFLDIFVNPTDIGGRYSALSLFGLVPAALMGIDLDALLAPARKMAEACRLEDPRRNPGLALGALMAAAAQSGRDKLTLLVPARLDAFGLWVEQLVAESTGKQGEGVIPIAGESPDAPMGDDRAVVSVRLRDEVTAPGAMERARATGAPIVSLQMSSVIDLGAEFFRWEVATAAAGFLLGINPFDEPNVQQAKDATRVLLDAFAADRRLPVPETHGSREGVGLTLSRSARAALAGRDPMNYLSLLGPADYLSVLAYLPPDERMFAEVFEEFRAGAGQRTGCPTMLGFGPRYLHSTGQLHKGGPNNGVFLIVTAELAEDLPIPDAAFSFGVLEMAQALGDFQSLDEAGRRVLYMHLPARDPELLARMTGLLLTPS